MYSGCWSCVRSTHARSCWTQLLIWLVILNAANARVSEMEEAPHEFIVFADPQYNGTCTDEYCGTALCPCPSLGEAITSAYTQANSTNATQITISCASGLYTGTANSGLFMGPSNIPIHIISQNGSGLTILDAPIFSRPLFTYTNGRESPPFHLQGFHVRASQVSQLSALFVASNGSVEIRDLAMANGPLNGGLLSITDSTVLLENCALEKLELGGTNPLIGCQSSVVTLVNVTFSSLNGPSKLILSNGTQLSIQLCLIEDCQLEDDTLQIGQAGEHVGDFTDTFEMLDTAILQNSNDGSFFEAFAANITLRNLFFEDHLVRGNFIETHLSHLSVEGCRVVSSILGQGAFFSQGYTHEKTENQTSPDLSVFFKDVVFRGNILGNGEFVGMMDCSGLFVNCLWEDNKGISRTTNSIFEVVNYISQFQTYEFSLQFVNCTVSGNVQSGLVAQTLMAISMRKGEISFDNCTFDKNRGSDPLLEVTSTDSRGVHFTNIVMTNNSGGILGWSKLTMSNSLLSNGSSTLLHVMKDATLSDVAFLENLSQNLGDALIQVGSLETHSCKLTLSRCLFDGNSATTGLIQVAGSELTLTDSIFTDNNSTFYSGCLNGYESTISVSNTTFLRNYSPLGGVLTASSSAVTITSCNMTQNFAGFGGVAFADAVTGFVVEDCEVAHNSGSERGGAFFIAGSGYIRNVSFHDNFGGHGGAIDFGAESSAVVESCIFRNNIAGSGGALSLRLRATPTIRNSIFENNAALSAGGAARIGGMASPIFEGCFFKNNTAYSSGGVASLTEVAAPSFSSCNFTGNYSPNEAGAIHCTDESNLTIDLCVFTANHAGSSGGALSFGVSSRGSITNAVITDNYATSKGGGIVCFNKCNPTFTDLVISENNAGSGAALWVTDSATPNFTRVWFENNHAASQAGALLSSDQAQGIINNCTFYNNSASSGGGGAVVGQDFAQTILQNCRFASNNAQNGGAVFAVAYAGPTIINSTFEDNMAYINGGGIFMGENCSATVRNVTCFRNVARGNGGCLSLADIARPIIEALNATDNLALTFGGAVTIADRSHPTITMSNFTSNLAMAGGAIITEQASGGHITNSTFVSNVALTSGGGVYLQSGYTTMESVLFFNNSALADEGGALDIDGTTNSFVNRTICSNCVFMSNKAPRGAGASVYITGSTGLLSSRIKAQRYATEPATFMGSNLEDLSSFKNCVFVANVAQEGGGIYYYANSNPVVTFNNTLLDDNVALEYGGGIYISYIGADAPFMENSMFIRNHGLYGGYNAAWRTISVLHDPGYFCTNCSYPPPDFVAPLGYSNEDGFATAPISATFIKGCPSPMTLDQPLFSIELQLFDAFGTLVNGTLLYENSYNVSMSYSGTNCNLSAPNGFISHFEVESGIATFSNLSIQSKNGSECALRFSIRSYPQGSSMSPLNCLIEMSGCPTDYKLMKSSPYDYCKYRARWLSTTQWLVVVIVALTAILICFVIVSMTFYALSLHRKKRKYQLINSHIPDFADGRPEVSLEDILSDPSISRIPYEDLEMGPRLGVGASGIVYQAEWRPPGEEPVQVAMKELLFSITDLHDQALQEFLIEIKLMSALENDNIVAFLGVSVVPEDNKLYLVTELMHQGNLRDVLDRKGENLPWKLRLKLAKDAAKGMAYLHSRNLIHRDLKPQNLLVNNNWSCKVSDFGISTVSSHTTHMTCIGTPIYMAPEVLAKDKYSEKADVFSFGVLLVEIYTAMRPYSEAKYAHFNQAQLMYQIVQNGARPDLSHLPVALQQLVSDCWAEDLRLRPSFPEIVVRLRRLSALKLLHEEQPDLRGSGEVGLASSGGRGVPIRSTLSNIDSITEGSLRTSDDFLREDRMITLSSSVLTLTDNTINS